MMNERTTRVLRAFEKYIDARLEYVLGQRQRQTVTVRASDPELAAAQHRSDMARVAAADMLDRAFAQKDGA